MAAFEALYRQYFGAVYDFAVRTMKDTHSAADAVQDAFIKAHDKIGQLRDPEAFRPWLYAIVRREALGAFRSQARETFVAPIDDADAGLNPLLSQVDVDVAGNPTTAAELSDSASLVWEAAASLDADTYTVLDLHVRQGLGSAEIAEVLGISKGNAYTKLNRMKERMGASISTYLLIRKGSKDCDELSAIVAGVELPPVSEKLRKRVDRHARSCDECSERRKALVAPMSIFAALAAVPAPAGLEEAIWADISNGSSGAVWRFTRRSFTMFALIGAFVLLLGLGTVVGAGFFSGDSGVSESTALQTEPGTVAPVVSAIPEAPLALTEDPSAVASDSSSLAVDPDTGLEPVRSPAPTTTTSPVADTTVAPVDVTTPASTVAPPPSVSITVPDTTLATVPSPPPPPDATPPPDTTLATLPAPPPPPPPDTTPPTITQASASPGAIWELDSNVISCPVDNARLSKITASVTDAGSGVTTVNARWTVAGSTSTTPMASVGAAYTADFGPFQAGTVVDNTSPSITVSITATDGEGNSSSTAVSVTLNSIAKCFG